MDSEVSAGSNTGADEPRPVAVVRGLAQYASLIVGALLLLLGWYGISGASQVAQQLPFFASATIPGAALVVSGAILINGDRTRRSQDRASEQIGTLYRLLTTAVESSPSTAAAASLAHRDATGAELLVVPGGSRFHRPDCALVAGKASAEAVAADEIATRDLEPCPICDPARPET